MLEKIFEKAADVKMKDIGEIQNDVAPLWDKLEKNSNIDAARADLRNGWSPFQKVEQESRKTFDDVAPVWAKLEKESEMGGRRIDMREAQLPFQRLEKEESIVSSFLPTDGQWEGEKGNSRWKPDMEKIPGDRHGTNPENKTWGEICKKYGIESIPFEDGEPDFSKVSKGEVQIKDFTDNRASNFDQADEVLAKQWNCTPEDVAKWRKENKYTWHEKSDCKTMQLVPTEVHGNVPHSGGISSYKAKMADVNNQKGA